MTEYTHDTERWLRSNAELYSRRGNQQMARNFELCAEDVKRLKGELAALKDAAGLVAEWYKQWGYAFVEERKKMFDELARLAEVEAQRDGLQSAIEACFENTAGRDSEWGVRAIGSFDILREAIAKLEEK